MAVLPYSDPQYHSTIGYTLPYSDPQFHSTIPVAEEWYVLEGGVWVPATMSSID